MLLSLVEFFPTFRRNALSQSLGSRGRWRIPHTGWIGDMCLYGVTVTWVSGKVVTIREGVGGTKLCTCGSLDSRRWKQYWFPETSAIAFPPTRRHVPHDLNRHKQPLENPAKIDTLFFITLSIRDRISSSTWFMDLLLIIFIFEMTYFRKGLSFAVSGHWILEVNSVCKSPGGVVVDTKGIGLCELAKYITFELVYNVMKGTEYFFTG
jgi:hypothetical protein